MSVEANTAHTNNVNNAVADKEGEGISTGMSREEHEAAQAAARFGYGPLAKISSAERATRLPAFGGEFQPGLYKAVTDRKIANPAPLGLCGFALTTFVLSLINVRARSLEVNNIVIGSAYAYGGLVQLLAGMWEMAIGNTFGATALSSYGGFWISFAIIITPGGFQIVEDIEDAAGPKALHDSLGYFLMGWFIFTFILLLCTLKSTVAFFTLFFSLDLAFMMLSIGYLQPADGTINAGCEKAGGWFGLIAAFMAWYNAMAGLADSSNSFFIVPVMHFPWSEKGMELRKKKTEHTV